MSEYAERDAEAQGEHYVRHVSALTKEGLYLKSDIAAELAHRDIEIERLQAENLKYKQEVARAISLLEESEQPFYDAIQRLKVSI